MFASFLFGLLAMAWVPLAGMVAYLLFIAVAAAKPWRAVPPTPHDHTFRVVIPAHNEALVLAPVLHRLRELDYPQTQLEVVVVADNCTDATAEIARNCGVRVIERVSFTERGKGHAVAYAFETLRAESFDAYVVLDADTFVEPDLLTVFNSYLGHGHRVIQAHYDVLNPWDSHRTALMHVAFSIFNYVRPLGRRTLGLSTGLKGNGMCFAKQVIDQYPWNAYSLAEDIEYTTTLLRHGEHIIFAPETCVSAQMPIVRSQATSQRVRWEAGRLQLARRDGLHLVGQGLLKRNAQLFDWGMDLLIPPLAALTMAVIGGIVVGIAAAVWTAAPKLLLLAWAWTVLLVALVLFVGIAMRVGRMPLAAYRAMANAPRYVIWKLWVYIRMGALPSPQSWVRTQRTQIQEPREQA
jgi:cellulose synthase/poly-beta-1,6-N-acetylglucosamine synthase-like glycosyltransferase